MVTKRELVLICALAFCLGVIFSNMTKTEIAVAATSNIVYETLDAKIAKVASDLNALRGRVSAIANKNNDETMRLQELSDKVKTLASFQKGTTVDVKNLMKRISVLEGKAKQP